RHPPEGPSRRESCTAWSGRACRQLMTNPRLNGDLVLDVQDLRTYLYTRWGTTKAVDGVSFQLHQGETLGIVGESGSGKSMTALSLLRLLPKPAARIEGGQVFLEGQDLLKLSEDEMRQVRGRKMALILQDPQTSLN